MFSICLCLKKINISCIQLQIILRITYRKIGLPYKWNRSVTEDPFLYSKGRKSLFILASSQKKPRIVGQKQNKIKTLLGNLIGDIKN